MSYSNARVLREVIFFTSRRLKLGDTHPHKKESLNNLIALYEAWNKPEKAEEWRARLARTEVAE